MFNWLLSTSRTPRPIRLARMGLEQEQVLETFKIVEIEVRAAAERPESEYGGDLMFRVFAPNGPLWQTGETKPQ
jgi:hypothetical protein